MDDVNVQVQVPATTQNTNQSSSSQSGNNQTGSNTSGNNVTLIPTIDPGKEPLISPREDAGLAVFAVLFIIIALIILILVFRDQLLKLLQKFVKRK